MMQVELRGWRNSPTSPMTEAVAATRAGHGDPEGPALLLGYTPVARLNPYQALLYKRFTDLGIAIASIPDPQTFDEYRHFTGLAPTVAVHVHWPAFVLRDHRSKTKARAKAAEFVARLDELRAAGVKIVFTVHNLIPHDAEHVDEEIHVQQALADRSDVVHVMSKSTVEATEGFLRLDPDRVVVSPHPNYRSAYPDYVSRTEARLTLGIDPDDIVYVLFGAIKRYKGLSKLIAALDIANRSSGRRRRLVVGGSPDDSADVRSFVKAASAHPDVLISAERIPAERVQYYLRAADVGLVPYERVLNSGAAQLYLSFDLPVVAAQSPAMWENLNPEIAEQVDGSDAPDLALAMVRADRLLTSATRDHVRAHVGHYAADELSRSFGLSLLERLGARLP